jgi:predicted nuclease with TOPRIM domain
VVELIYKQKNKRLEAVVADENKYVEGKKNSRATKTARKLWVEDKIRAYQRELEGLDIEIASDDKVISKLEKLDGEREAVAESLASAQRRMTALEGEAFDATLDTYIALKAKVAKVEAEMRSVYYGR